LIQGILLSRFPKTIDKVQHKRLILKLVAHVIDGKLLECIEKWLLDRKQSVVINGVSQARKMCRAVSHRVLFWHHCYL